VCAVCMSLLFGRLVLITLRLPPSPCASSDPMAVATAGHRHTHRRMKEDRRHSLGLFTGYGAYLVATPKFHVRTSQGHGQVAAAAAPAGNTATALRHLLFRVTSAAVAAAYRPAGSLAITPHAGRWPWPGRQPERSKWAVSRQLVAHLRINEWRRLIERRLC